MKTSAPPNANRAGASAGQGVKPWEICREHGPAEPRVWACPTCLIELRDWKAAHAPRLEALEALLNTARQEANGALDAVAMLATERAANASLKDELERLRTVAGQVLRDMEAQDVLIEWQTTLEEALTPNATAAGVAR